MTYTERLNQLKTQKKVLKKRKNIVGIIRLIVILTIAYAGWNLFPVHLPMALLAIAVLIGIFLYLVAISSNLAKELQINSNLVAINKEELAIADFKYYNRDEGKEYLHAEHPYANDLDLFGRASLFQYINRSCSEQGGRTLSDWLLAPTDSTTILARQTAIRELGPMLEWRQELQARGMLSRIRIETETKINSFIQSATIPFTKGGWKIVRFIGPAIMCSLLILHIYDYLNAGYFYLSVFVAFLFTGWISKRIIPVYAQINKISPEMDTLAFLLQHVEHQSFKSPLLQEEVKALKHISGSASKTIKKFRRLLDNLDIRLNPLVFIPLNIFLFWDLQQLFALSKWKDNTSNNPIPWIRSLANLEALQSLATLHFNHADWPFPELEKEHGIFNAVALAHPLIPATKRVASSFTTAGTPQISLITGSNMAGKSTFLRSVGVNTVLAMAGAPVCAQALRLSPMRVMSSMRIADNLEESTSTFYAELKKLQTIITAVNNHEPVFLLLDEILRGTNSLDRHTGSAALIRQLIRKQAVGLIATHDLELANMEGITDDNLKNYHFDVQVKGEELYFDYALKQGICTSMNASILMKKIGIEM